MLHLTRNATYPVNFQMPSQLWAFSLQIKLTMWSQPISYFQLSSSLFFILYSIKAFCLLPHFAGLRMQTAQFDKCLFVSPKLSSSIILNSILLIRMMKDEKMEVRKKNKEFFNLPPTYLLGLLSLTSYFSFPEVFSRAIFYKLGQTTPHPALCPRRLIYMDHIPKNSGFPLNLDNLEVW